MVVMDGLIVEAGDFVRVGRREVLVVGVVRLVMVRDRGARECEAGSDQGPVEPGLPVEGRLPWSATGRSLRIRLEPERDLGRPGIDEERGSGHGRVHVTPSLESKRALIEERGRN